MGENNWTAKEMEFSHQLKKIHDEDVAEIPFLDTSFMKDDSGKKKSRKKFSRLGTIAAVIMLMAVSSLVTAISISSGYVEAFKEGIERKLFTWNSAVEVSQTEISSDEHIETWEITDSKLMPELKEMFYGLRVPEYIPTTYEFETILIESSANDEYIATSHYRSNKDTLLIVQTPIHDGSTLGGSSDGKVIELPDRTISIYSDYISDIRGCTVFFEDVMIQISSSLLSEDEIEKIAKGMT